MLILQSWWSYLTKSLESLNFINKLLPLFDMIFWNVFSSKRTFEKKRERKFSYLVLLECEDGIPGLQTSMFVCSEVDLWREAGTPLKCLHRLYILNLGILSFIIDNKLTSSKQYDFSQVNERKRRIIRITRIRQNSGSLWYKSVNLILPENLPTEFPCQCLK